MTEKETAEFKAASEAAERWPSDIDALRFCAETDRSALAKTLVARIRSEANQFGPVLRAWGDTISPTFTRLGTVVAHNGHLASLAWEFHVRVAVWRAVDSAQCVEAFLQAGEAQNRTQIAFDPQVIHDRWPQMREWIRAHLPKTDTLAIAAQIRVERIEMLQRLGAPLPTDGALDDRRQDGAPPPPVWRRDLRTLSFGGRVVLQFSTQPAPCQSAILATFQELDWPDRIDNPLASKGHVSDADRAREALRKLNDSLAGQLRFRMDGTATGILWVKCEEVEHPLDVQGLSPHRGRHRSGKQRKSGGKRRKSDGRH